MMGMIYTYNKNDLIINTKKSYSDYFTMNDTVIHVKEIPDIIQALVEVLEWKEFEVTEASELLKRIHTK